MKHFKWEKLGLFFSPSSQYDWLQTHAMLPTAEICGHNMVKIYFASRNLKNQSYIGWIRFNLDTLQIEDMSQNPIFSPGKLGTFDDNGVLPSSLLKINDQKYMYYIGFKPGGTTRMDLFGGLARFNSSDVLERVSEAPIIERCSVNPYINTAPFVIESKLNSPYKYFMYYVAGCGWINKDLPRYNIQIAFSNDGVNWDRSGKVCIDFKDLNEVALARPYVVFIDGKYHMWFSYKGENYKIGYAISDDGIVWDRQDDKGGLQATNINGDFDSDMVAYGCIVHHNNRLFMFYNGNNYGYSGIGLAISHV